MQAVWQVLSPHLEFGNQLPCRMGFRPFLLCLFHVRGLFVTSRHFFRNSKYIIRNIFLIMWYLLFATWHLLSVSCTAIVTVCTEISATTGQFLDNRGILVKGHCQRMWWYWAVKWTSLISVRYAISTLYTGKSYLMLSLITSCDLYGKVKYE